MPAKKAAAPKIAPEVVQKIKDDAARANADPGLWSREAAAKAGPACICGMRSRGRWNAAGGGVPTGECARHEGTTAPEGESNDPGTAGG